MEKLENLISDVMSKADTCKDLQKQEKELKHSLELTVRENIINLVCPVLGEYSKILDKLSRTGIHPAREVRVLKQWEETDGRTCWIMIVTRDDEMWIEVKRGARSDTITANTPLTTGNVKFDSILELYEPIIPFFINEDTTEREVMVKVREEFTKMLNNYSVSLAETNTTLSESIKALEEQIKRSHGLEVKEDGTVEVCLGGKIYTAKLKEEN